MIGYNLKKYINMIVGQEREIKEEEHIKTKTIAKRERTGRWSAAESHQFESLLEKYGKNWKKIQEHIKGRTLGQIRSHAQKFFEKVGAQKVAQYSRKAKILEAYETLEKEKELFQQHFLNNLPDVKIEEDIQSEDKFSTPVKIQDQSGASTAMADASSCEQTPMFKPSETLIKEQQVQATPEYIKNDVKQVYYSQVGQSYLSELLRKNWKMFQSNGYSIDPFIEHPGSRKGFKLA